MNAVRGDVERPLQETRVRERNGRWTEEEHEQFLEGLRLHGKEWKAIGRMIPSRSIVQIRTHGSISLSFPSFLLFSPFSS